MSLRNLKTLFFACFFIFISFETSQGQELTHFELPERELTEEDSTETEYWLSDSTLTDTIEYHAVDLIYDVESSTFNLNKDARLSFKTASLNADTILFNQESSVLVASGDPIIRETKNPSLAGMRMKYNMKNKIGEVYYATTYQDNNQINGMEVKRLPDSRLFISRGDFSTCNDSTHQHYYFYGRRMVIKPKETITIRPVVLNIADVPVAVLPMVVAPLKSGRKSGLLTPKFGGDQVQGYYMRNIGFYYAPNDYMDATIKGDLIEGEQARFEKTTLTGEVRYRIRYLLDGNISYTSYLKEFDFANSGYDISFAHNQNLTPDAKHTLSGSGSFVSSQSVRQDNGLDAETILNQQANAQMTYAGRFGTNKNLTVKTQQQYNLVTGLIERQLPDIQYRQSGPLFEFETDEDEIASEPSFLEKFNYSFSNRANVYTRTAEDTLANEDTTALYMGYTGNFSLDYSGSLFDVINITPKASFDAFWTGRSWINPEDSLKYRKARTSFDPTESEYGEFAYNHNYSLTADTKLYGIWVPEIGRFTGIRHVLSPSISYTYAPEIDTVKKFAPHPLLSQTPYQKEQKTIGFSLSNDIDIKYLLSGGFFSKDTTEDDSLNDQSENYATRRLLTTKHNVSYNFAADSLEWSDISSSFGLQILKDYMFTIRTKHSVYHKYSNTPHKVQFPELTQWSYELSKSFNWSGNFNAGLPSQLGKYEMNKWTLGFDYRYTFTSKRVGKDLFRDDISHASSISATLQPTTNWIMSYSTRYNYNEGRFVSHNFTFERTLHCWKLDFTWTPTGPAAGWSLALYITDLPDIKINMGSTETDSD